MVPWQQWGFLLYSEACTDSEFILCVPDDLWYFLLIEMSELDACIVFWFPKIDSDPSLNKPHVTLMISHPCALVLLAMFGSDMYEPWNLECELTHVCHSSSLYRRSCMTDLKKQNKKKKTCTHVSSIVSVFFVPQEVTGAVSYSSSLRPLNTRQSVCVCASECLCVCVFIGVGRLRICLALSELQQEQFGQLWLAVKKLKHWRWLQRRH